MKRLSAAFMTFVLAMTCGVLFAQQPQAGGMGRGHMRRPMTPPATGPMLKLANNLAEAINKQDAAALEKMLAPDAVYLDEDGHAPPALAWVRKLTTGAAAKHIEISATHGQTWGDAGWVSFNYTLTEQFRGEPKTLKGTASIVARKAAGAGAACPPTAGPPPPRRCARATRISLTAPPGAGAPALVLAPPGTPCAAGAPPRARRALLARALTHLRTNVPRPGTV